MTDAELLALFPGLSFEVEQILVRPDGLMGEMPRHFRIVLSSEPVPVPEVQPPTLVVFYFSQGSAHTQPPTLADVLTSLAMDAIVSDLNFRDFCSEFCYNTDSRISYKIWKACRLTATKLMDLGFSGKALQLLANEEFEQLAEAVKNNQSDIWVV